MKRLILLTDFTESYAHHIQKGILEYSKRTEPWCVSRMPPSFKQQNGIEGVLRWAKSWGADAIIGRFNEDDPIHLLTEAGIVVVAQDYQKRFETVPNITGNYHKTGEIAADFFIQRGMHHFAFYGLEGMVWSEERKAGFFERLLSRHATEVCHSLTTTVDEDVWYYDLAPIQEWVTSLPKPIAIFTCDDNSAHRLAEACSNIGVRIPEDVSILGVDNDEMMCQMSAASLSSISLNIQKGGYEAASLIDSLISDPSRVWQDIVIEPIEPICRLSTDLFSTGDALIFPALQYIHNNICSSISVEDVVRLVPLSRRRLEIRFKAATQLSIYHYILRLKVEYLSQLLITEKGSVKELATRVGITDMQNISRLFRSFKGISPTAYREIYSHTPIK